MQWIFGIQLSDLQSALFKIVAALIILLFGIIAANILAKLFKKLLHSFEIDSVLSQSGFKFPMEELLSNLLKYIIYFVALIWALTELGMATTVLHIILIVILIILVIFIVLAFKDFIPNITAGFFVHSKAEIEKGDKIVLGAVEGTVIDIALLETKIKTREGDIVVIPNSVLMKSEIKIKRKRK